LMEDEIIRELRQVRERIMRDRDPARRNLPRQSQESARPPSPPRPV
jgi:hypothetical protein